MNRVAIVADSSACLPGDLIDRYGIRLVPLALNADGQAYHDGSLTPAQMFEIAERSRTRVQTAAPSPGDFRTEYEQARNTGAASVLCLTLSSKYSGTFASAQAGAELSSDIPIRVVDTGGLAMTHGLAVLAAARSLCSGATVEEAASTAERVGHAGRLIGALETLHYLVKGGRVPWIVGWAASVLSIKPVLVFEDGRARSIGRPRTWDAARQQIIRQLEGVRTQTPVAVMHTGAPDRAADLAKAVAGVIEAPELLLTEFTSVMAVHTGPGFVGVAVCPDA